jgi:hypothetical protein
MHLLLLNNIPPNELIVKRLELGIAPGAAPLRRAAKLRTQPVGGRLQRNDRLCGTSIENRQLGPEMPMAPSPDT